MWILPKITTEKMCGSKSNCHRIWLPINPIVQFRWIYRVSIVMGGHKSGDSAHTSNNIASNTRTRYTMKRNEIWCYIRFDIWLTMANGLCFSENLQHIPLSGDQFRCIGSENLHATTICGCARCLPHQTNITSLTRSLMVILIMDWC